MKQHSVHAQRDVKMHKFRCQHVSVGMYLGMLACMIFVPKSAHAYSGVTDSCGNKARKLQRLSSHLPFLKPGETSLNVAPWSPCISSAQHTWHGFRVLIRSIETSSCDPWEHIQTCRRKASFQLPACPMDLLQVFSKRNLPCFVISARRMWLSY